MKNFDIIGSKDGKSYILIEKTNGKPIIKSDPICYIDNDTVGVGIPSYIKLIRLNHIPYDQYIETYIDNTPMLFVGTDEEYPCNASITITMNNTKLVSIYKSLIDGDAIDKILVTIHLSFKHTDKVIDMRNKDRLSVSTTIFQKGSSISPIIIDEDGDEVLYLYDANTGAVLDAQDNNSIKYESYDGDYRKL